MRKLMDFGAFTAVKKEEARGNLCFLYNCVDKRKEGVAKSRFRVADVKSKTPDKEQQETPEKQQEFANIAVDVVSSYPHAKEKEDVYVQAVIGYKHVINGFSPRGLEKEALV